MEVCPSCQKQIDTIKLLKCKSGFEQNDDQCIPPSPNCYKTCETCSKDSDDENNQYCLSCKENFNLYGINCKENCPERYKAENRKCEKCTDDHCSSFLINTCDCTKCIDGFYVKDHLCEKCIENCNICTNYVNLHFFPIMKME